MFSARKILFSSLIIGALVLSVISPIAYAASQASTSNWNAHNQTSFSWELLLSAMGGCSMWGVPFIPSATCPGHKSDGTLFVYDQLPNGGAMGGLTSVMVAMYESPPISSSQYIADIGTHLGLVSPAYADTIAGSGNGVLTPVIRLWDITKNLAYLGFVIIFIAVGFMIMFRQKINPQTVVSIQSALPGLVIGLILVTFSYFLSALIIDISFFGMSLIAYIFVNAGPNVVSNENMLRMGQSTNVLDMYNTFVFNQNTSEAILKPILASFKALIPGLGEPVTGNIFDRAIGFIRDGIIQEAVGKNLIGPLVMFIFSLALIIQMVRLLWELLKAYITVLVTTVLSPFIILFGSLPGKSGNFAMWWKNILANTLVFPAVFAAYLFAGLFLANVDSVKQTMPMLGGFTTNILAGLVGLAIILGTPAIPGMIKGALGVKDAGGPLIAAAFGALGTSISLNRAAGSRLIEPYVRERGTFREYATKARVTPWVGAGGVPVAGTPWYARWFNR